MWEKFRQIWVVKELRNKILFVLAMLLIFRIAAHIPIPGIDVGNLKSFFQENQLLGLLNLFSGGGMENFSVVMLGVAPYITASIIFQLLTMVIPRLEELQKEGEAGRAKLNQYQRVLSIPLAALQAYSMITILRQSGRGIVGAMSMMQLSTTIITITAGTIFLMWIGELINEKKIGNGISLIIFAGIVANVPTQIQRTLATFDMTQLGGLIAFGVVGVLTVAAIVVITEGQRNIPVSYAKRIRGMRMYGGVNTHLPLKVNQAGVIPIIFAVSIVLVPPMIAQFFVNSSVGWLASAAAWTVATFQNQFIYAVMYFVLVVVFTYFYTAVVFHPTQIAENLQKQGGFIPGIRPGKPTSDFLGYVSNRIILGGALFLGIIAILPNVIQSATKISTLVVGGTSLLIVVSVVIEVVKQIESQLVMRNYEGF
ncbi:MAG: preprotein translocase subunit SecY [Patescibacteria group bacterium]|nr:preprotein translocase subunit SecY [Patescibacteria group bacterium]MDD5715356.1 preprotein translocase subunit SecY [Patescibacteria group bacterium]